MPIRHLAPFAFVPLVFVMPAFGAQPAPDTPLVVDNFVKVDVLDVEANLTRVPPEKRGNFRLSYDRLAGVVDGVFVARSLAEKARALGLDQDPVVQRRMQQVQEEVLAGAYQQKLEDEVMAMDLQQRAKEIYMADRAKYSTPEMVRVQHILIGLKGRTREAARERANEAYTRAKAGDGFLDLVERYSEAPSKSLDHGDLDYVVTEKFGPPLRAEIAKLKKEGDISPPVEMDDGFHIVRMVDRKPSQQLSFDDVRERIIALEHEKLKKRNFEAELMQIRSSPTAVAYPENVEKLVLKIDPALIRRAIDAQNAIGKELEAQKQK